MWSALSGKTSDKPKASSSSRANQDDDMVSVKSSRRKHRSDKSVAGGESSTRDSKKKSSSSAKSTSRGDDRADRGFGDSSDPYTNGRSRGESISHKSSKSRTNERDEDDDERRRRKSERTTDSNGEKHHHRRRRSRSAERTNGEQDPGDRSLMRRSTDPSSGRSYGESDERTRAAFDAPSGGGPGFGGQFPGQFSSQMPGMPGGFQRVDSDPTSQHSYSHVPQQFPGQFPSETAAPYQRPSQASHEGGIGLASDYYNDNGESVHHQPGARPGTPVIAGTQPHLMSAGHAPNPPQEPSASGGVGAAADFYGGGDFGTTPERPPKPGKPSKPGKTSSSSTPSKPSKISKPSKTSKPSSSAAALGAAAATMGVGSYYMSGAQPHDNTPTTPTQAHLSANPDVSPRMSPDRPSSYHTANGGPQPNYSQGTSSSHHSNAAMYATAGAAAAAGLAAYEHHQHSQQSHHQSSQYGISDEYSNKPPPGFHYASDHNHGGYTSGGGYGNGYANGHGGGGAIGTSQQHKHKGPIARLVDFFRDPEGVAQFEEYTEYIGVCQYCFDPRSSVRDAPRKHHYGRSRKSWEKMNRSGESLHSRRSYEKFNSSRTSVDRVDKGTRYGTSSRKRRESDYESDRKSSGGFIKGAVAAGTAGVVASKLMERNNDFQDTYSTKSGRDHHQERRRRDSSSDRDRKGRSVSYGVTSNSRTTERKGERKESKGEIYGVDRHGNPVRRSSLKTDSASEKRRSSKERESDRKGNGLKDAVIGAGVGAGLAAAAMSRRRSSSPSNRPSGVQRLQKRRDSSSSSSSGRTKARRKSSNSRPGILSGLFGGGALKRKKSKTSHSTKKRKEKDTGFFGLGNGSYSSTDSALILDDDRRDRQSNKKTSSNGKHRKNRSESPRIKSDSDARNAVLALGAGMAALEAHKASKSGYASDRSRQTGLQGKHHIYEHESSKRRHASEPEDDNWEDFSDDDSDSVDLALAWPDEDRLRRKRSKDSLSDASIAERWSWRWGGGKKSRSPSPKLRSHEHSHTPPGAKYSNGAALPAAAIAAGVGMYAYENGKRRDISSQIPMREVEPRPVSETGTADAPRFVSPRPGPVPIQQPQPISPVKKGVYDAKMPGGFPDDHRAAVAQEEGWGRKEKLRRTTSSPPPQINAFDQNKRNSSGALVQFQFDREQQLRHDREEEEELRNSQIEGVEYVPGESKTRRKRVTKEEKAQREQQREDKAIRKEEVHSSRIAELEKEIAETNKRLAQLRDGSEDEYDQRRVLEKSNASQQSSNKSSVAPVVEAGGAAVAAALITRALSGKSNERAAAPKDERREKTRTRSDSNRTSEPRIDKRSDDNRSLHFEESVKGKKSRERQDEVRQQYPGDRQYSSRPENTSDRGRESKSDIDITREELASAGLSRITRDVAQKVRQRSRSPAEHSSYAEFFAPVEELSRPAGYKESSATPVDHDITVYRADVVPIEPHGPENIKRSTSPYSYPPDIFFHPDTSGLDLPWTVPDLQLIRPSPIPSPRIEPVHKHDDVEEPEEQRREQSPPKNKVQFGSNKTHTYEARTPEEEHSNYIRDAAITGAAVTAVAGAATYAGRQSKSKEKTKADKAAKAEKRRSSEFSFQKPTEPETPVDEELSRDDIEAEERDWQRTHRMAGGFGDDDEFAAIAAAGAKSAGFDPEIVIKDPKFRERESPPGSGDEYLRRGSSQSRSRDTSYERRRPSPIEQIFGRSDSPGTEGAPPQEGFVEPESLPNTPADELKKTLSRQNTLEQEKRNSTPSSKTSSAVGGRARDIEGPANDAPDAVSASFEDVDATKLNKKERKKLKEKRKSMEAAAATAAAISGVSEGILPADEDIKGRPAPARVSSAAAENVRESSTSRDLSAPQTEFEEAQRQSQPEIPEDEEDLSGLTKKERKKRENEKRRSVINEAVTEETDTTPAPAAAVDSAPVEKEEDWSNLTKKERKKREKEKLQNLAAAEPEEAVIEPISEPVTEEWDIPSVSKKDKKKKKRQSMNVEPEAEESVPAEPLVEPAPEPTPEPANDDWEAATMSKKDKKKKKRQSMTTDPEPQELTSASAPATEPAEDDWEAGLTKKEKKKRDKEKAAEAALAVGAAGIAAAEFVDSPTSYGPESSRDVPQDDEDWSGLSNKDRKKREKAKRASLAEQSIKPEDTIRLVEDDDAELDIINAAAREPEEPSHDDPRSKKKERKSTKELLEKAIRQNDDEMDFINDYTDEKPEKPTRGFSDIVDAARAGRAKDIKGEKTRDTSSASQSRDEFFDAEADAADNAPTPTRHRSKSRDGASTPSAAGVPLPSESGASTPTYERMARGQEPLSFDDGYGSDGARSTAYTAIGTGEDRERRKKKKRHSKHHDDDDTKSVVSTPGGRDKGRDSPKEEKKKGLFGGLFSRKTDDADKRRKEEKEAAETEEERKERKRRHRRSKDGLSVYGGSDDDTRSVVSHTPSRSESRGDGHHHHRKHRSHSRHDGESRDRHHRREPSQRSAGFDSQSTIRLVPDDDPSKSRDQAEELQSFLGERPEKTKPPDIAEQEPRSHDGLVGLGIAAGAALAAGTLPAAEKELIGQAEEGSPRQVTGAQDNIDTPVAAPTSPTKTPKHRSTLSAVSDSSKYGASSPTAIPLVFRRPPNSRTGSTASTPGKSPSAPNTPGKKDKERRPASTEFKGKADFRPLYLVERHRKPETNFDPDEELPTLPSSKSTSRASSVHEEDTANEPVLESPSKKFLGEPLNLEAARNFQPTDVLDADQPTPTIASVKADRAKREQDHLDASMQEHMARELEWQQRQRKGSSLTGSEIPSFNQNNDESVRALGISDHVDRPDSPSSMVATYHEERNSTAKDQFIIPPFKPKEQHSSGTFSEQARAIDEQKNSNNAELALGVGAAALAGGALLASRFAERQDGQLSPVVEEAKLHSPIVTEAPPKTIEELQPKVEEPVVATANEVESVRELGVPADPPLVPTPVDETHPKSAGLDLEKQVDDVQGPAKEAAVEDEWAVPTKPKKNKKKKGKKAVEPELPDDKAEPEAVSATNNFGSAAGAVDDDVFHEASEPTQEQSREIKPSQDPSIPVNLAEDNSKSTDPEGLTEGVESQQLAVTEADADSEWAESNTKKGKKYKKKKGKKSSDFDISRGEQQDELEPNDATPAKPATAVPIEAISQDVPEEVQETSAVPPVDMETKRELEPSQPDLGVDVTAEAPRSEPVPDAEAAKTSDVVENSETVAADNDFVFTTKKSKKGKKGKKGKQDIVTETSEDQPKPDVSEPSADVVDPTIGASNKHIDVPTDDMSPINVPLPAGEDEGLAEATPEPLLTATEPPIDEPVPSAVPLPSGEDHDLVDDFHETLETQPQPEPVNDVLTPKELPVPEGSVGDAQTHRASVAADIPEETQSETKATDDDFLAAATSKKTKKGKKGKRKSILFEDIEAPKQEPDEPSLEPSVSEATDTTPVSEPEPVKDVSSSETPAPDTIVDGNEITNDLSAAPAGAAEESQSPPKETEDDLWGSSTSKKSKKNKKKQRKSVILDDAVVGEQASASAPDFNEKQLEPELQSVKDAPADLPEENVVPVPGNADKEPGQDHELVTSTATDKPIESAAADVLEPVVLEPTADAVTESTAAAAAAAEQAPEVEDDWASTPNTSKSKKKDKKKNRKSKQLDDVEEPPNSSAPDFVQVEADPENVQELPTEGSTVPQEADPMQSSTQTSLEEPSTSLPQIEDDLTVPISAKQKKKDKKKRKSQLAAEEPEQADTAVAEPTNITDLQEPAQVDASIKEPTLEDSVLESAKNVPETIDRLDTQEPEQASKELQLPSMVPVEATTASVPDPEDEWGTQSSSKKAKKNKKKEKKRLSQVEESVSTAAEPDVGSSMPLESAPAPVEPITDEPPIIQPDAWAKEATAEPVANDIVSGVPKTEDDMAPAAATESDATAEALDPFANDLATPLDVAPELREKSTEELVRDINAAGSPTATEITEEQMKPETESLTATNDNTVEITSIQPAPEQVPSAIIEDSRPIEAPSEQPENQPADDEWASLPAKDKKKGKKNKKGKTVSETEPEIQPESETKAERVDEGNLGEAVAAGAAGVAAGMIAESLAPDNSPDTRLEGTQQENEPSKVDEAIAEPEDDWGFPPGKKKKGKGKKKANNSTSSQPDDQQASQEATKAPDSLPEDPPADIAAGDDFSVPEQPSEPATAEDDWGVSSSSKKAKKKSKKSKRTSAFEEELIEEKPELTEKDANVSSAPTPAAGAVPDVAPEAIPDVAPDPIPDVATDAVPDVTTAVAEPVDESLEMARPETEWTETPLSSKKSKKDKKKKRGSIAEIEPAQGESTAGGSVEPTTEPQASTTTDEPSDIYFLDSAAKSDNEVAADPANPEDEWATASSSSKKDKKKKKGKKNRDSIVDDEPLLAEPADQEPTNVAAKLIEEPRTMDTTMAEEPTAPGLAEAEAQIPALDHDADVQMTDATPDVFVPATVFEDSTQSMDIDDETSTTTSGSKKSKKKDKQAKKRNSIDATEPHNADSAPTDLSNDTEVPKEIDATTESLLDPMADEGALPDTLAEPTAEATKDVNREDAEMITAENTEHAKDVPEPALETPSVVVTDTATEDSIIPAAEAVLPTTAATSEQPDADNDWANSVPRKSKKNKKNKRASLAEDELSRIPDATAGSSAEPTAPESEPAVQAQEQVQEKELPMTSDDVDQAANPDDEWGAPASSKKKNKKKDKKAKRLSFADVDEEQSTKQSQPPDALSEQGSTSDTPVSKDTEGLEDSFGATGLLHPSPSLEEAVAFRPEDEFAPLTRTGSNKNKRVSWPADSELVVEHEISAPPSGIATPAELNISIPSAIKDLPPGTTADQIPSPSWDTSPIETRDEDDAWGFGKKKERRGSQSDSDSGSPELERSAEPVNTAVGGVDDDEWAAGFAKKQEKKKGKKNKSTQNLDNDDTSAAAMDTVPASDAPATGLGISEEPSTAAPSIEAEQADDFGGFGTSKKSKKKKGKKNKKDQAATDDEPETPTVADAPSTVPAEEALQADPVAERSLAPEEAPSKTHIGEYLPRDDTVTSKESAVDVPATAEGTNIETGLPVDDANNSREPSTETQTTEAQPEDEFVFVQKPKKGKNKKTKKDKTVAEPVPEAEPNVEVESAPVEETAASKEDTPAVDIAMEGVAGPADFPAESSSASPRADLAVEPPLVLEGLPHDSQEIEAQPEDEFALVPSKKKGKKSKKSKGSVETQPPVEPDRDISAPQENVPASTDAMEGVVPGKEPSDGPLPDNTEAMEGIVATDETSTQPSTLNDEAAPTISEHAQAATEEAPKVQESDAKDIPLDESWQDSPAPATVEPEDEWGASFSGKKKDKKKKNKSLVVEDVAEPTTVSSEPQEESSKVGHAETSDPTNDRALDIKEPSQSTSAKVVEPEEEWGGFGGSKKKKKKDKKGKKSEVVEETTPPEPMNDRLVEQEEYPATAAETTEAAEIVEESLNAPVQEEDKESSFITSSKSKKKKGKKSRASQDLDASASLPSLEDEVTIVEESSTDRALDNVATEPGDTTVAIDDAAAESSLVEDAVLAAAATAGANAALHHANDDNSSRPLDVVDTNEPAPAFQSVSADQMQLDDHVTKNVRDEQIPPQTAEASAENVFEAAPSRKQSKGKKNKKTKAADFDWDEPQTEDTAVADKSLDEAESTPMIDVQVTQPTQAGSESLSSEKLSRKKSKGKKDKKAKAFEDAWASPEPEAEPASAGMSIEHSGADAMELDPAPPAQLPEEDFQAAPSRKKSKSKKDKKSKANIFAMDEPELDNAASAGTSRELPSETTITDPFQDEISSQPTEEPMLTPAEVAKEPEEPLPNWGFGRAEAEPSATLEDPPTEEDAPKRKPSKAKGAGVAARMAMFEAGESAAQEPLHRSKTVRRKHGPHHHEDVPTTPDMEMASEPTYNLNEPTPGRDAERSPELPTLAEQGYMTPTRDVDRDPSPVDSTSKERSSAALFSSSPSIRDTPTQTRHLPHRSIEEVSREENYQSMHSPPATPTFDGRPGRSLTTVTEQSPEEQAARRLRHERGDSSQVDSALRPPKRRSAYGLPEHRASTRSPLPEHDRARRLGHISGDDLHSKYESEGQGSHETARKSSGRPERPRSILTSGELDPNQRPFSAASLASVRSNDSISAYIRDDRPTSVSPSLRHEKRSVSSDLRKANRDSPKATGSRERGGEREGGSETMTGSESKQEALGGEELTALGLAGVGLAATAAAIAGPSTYDPATDKGKGRITRMNDVYEAWGEQPGSPRSPSRPQSVRRRQSLQILDLEGRLESLVSENRLLQDSKAKAERQLETTSHEHSSSLLASQEAVKTRDVYLQQKDTELEALRNVLNSLQGEVARLTEANRELTESKAGEGNIAEQYRLLQAEHVNTRQLHEESTRELNEIRDKHSSMSHGMEGIVAAEVASAVASKDSELRELRTELEAAQNRIRALQQQITESRNLTGDDDILTVRDADYFDTKCQQLCQHVQQWVLRFSKFSDMKKCRRVEEIRDEKIVDRFENTTLDGTEVDDMLQDRVRRRDVFMSVVMTMIFEFVFARYLFGMDREQRQKLKVLEKTLTDVGPPAAVSKWRATTLTLLTRRKQFRAQREQDTEAVVREIYDTLSVFLPPPAHLVSQITASLTKVLNLAVDLHIDMRTQKADYVMLPPLVPEYDTNGDLARTVPFNSELMNERSGKFNDNDDVPTDSVVRIVLFPLVVKEGEDERDIVCPAQVLIAKDDDRRGKRGISEMPEAMRTQVSVAPSIAPSAFGGPSEGGMF